MTILFEDFDHVVVNHSETQWQAEGLEDDIARIWNERLAQSELQNFTLFNGQVVRAISMKQSEKTLYIETQETDYRHDVATRANQDIAQRANPLYAAAIVRVWDKGVRYQAFGINEGGSEAAGLGKLNVVAGVVEPSDLKENNGSVEQRLFSELCEEIGLLRQDIKTIKPGFVIVEDHWQHPSIVYIVTTSLNMDEVSERYFDCVQKDISNGRKPEHGNLQFIRDNYGEINRAIQSERFEGRVNLLELHYMKHFMNK